MSIKWILRLYPPAWRERYEEEMLALLEQHTSSPLTLLDLLLGALDARIDPYYRRESRPNPMQSLKMAATTFICIFPIFFIAQILWAIWVSDPSGMLYKIFLANTNPIAELCSTLITIAVIIIWLSVVVSGLLLAAATARTAFAERRIKVFLAAVLPGLFTFFSPLLLAFWQLFAPAYPTPDLRIQSWLILFLTPIISLLLALLALKKGRLGRKVTGIALVLATIATLAMTSSVCINIVWAISLWNDIFQYYSIPIPVFTQWLIGWAINILFIALPTVIAFFVLIRGMLSFFRTPAPLPMQTPLQKQQ